MRNHCESPALWRNVVEVCSGVGVRNRARLAAAGPCRQRDEAARGREAVAGDPDRAAAEVAECARLGFTEQAIAWSRGLAELGPRGSLSDEGRVLRYCLLTCDADESVRELSREERRRSWGGSEVRWTLPETTSRAYAKTLEQEAATHA